MRRYDFIRNTSSNVLIFAAFTAVAIAVAQLYVGNLLAASGTDQLLDGQRIIKADLLSTRGTLHLVIGIVGVIVLKVLVVLI